MNKSELIDALAASFEGNRKAAAHALESVVDTITREVARGEKVAITGFGSFEKRVRDARWVRNPATGERIKAQATAIARFKPGAELMGVVSGARKLPETAIAAAADLLPDAITGRKSATDQSASAPATAKKTATQRAAESPAKKVAAGSGASSAEKSTAKKATAKKTAAKRSPAKKATAKKTSAAGTTAAKKATGKKAAATPATKVAAGSGSSTTAKKSAAKKTAAKKSAAKKAPAKKTTARKAPAKKTTGGSAGSA